MRKILVLAAAALITFSGCSKKDSSPSYSMKATIGASTFSTSRCVAVAAGGALTIDAWTGTTTSAAPPQITIAITTWNGGTGTITFDSLLTTGYEEYLPNMATVSTSKTGSVNITSVSSKTISGTFSFTCDDGTVVSNGSFTAQRP